VNVCAYPKSGSHLTQHILRAGKIESAQTHVLSQWEDVDLHVMRDIRGIVPSAVCHFVLGGPASDEDIRPHCREMARCMLVDWKSLGAPGGWSAYVEELERRARHTVTFADLVERPRAALFPLVDIGDAAEELIADERLILQHMDPEQAWLTKWKYRVGDPRGWGETLGPELAEEIAEMFAPGLEVLERVRLASTA